MTKKHFEAIAALLNRHAKRHEPYNDDASISSYHTVEELADELADLFAAENPRFDRETFLTECGF